MSCIFDMSACLLAPDCPTRLAQLYEALALICIPRLLDLSACIYTRA